MISPDSPEEDLAKRLKRLEDRLTDDAKKPSKQEVAFPDYGRIWQPFNRKTIKRDIDNAKFIKTDSGIPKSVVGFRGTISVVTVNGRAMNRLSLRWVNPSDPNYDGARVWIKGYMTDNELGIYGSKANVQWTLLAEVQDSPYTANLEATGEEVLVCVQAVNKDRRGAELRSLPSKSFILTTNTSIQQPAYGSQITLS